MFPRICFSFHRVDNRLVHKFVSYNGQIVPSDGAELPALSAAALYGKNVFTTVAVYGGGAHWWFEHWRRLVRDAPKVGVDISAFDLGEVGKEIDKVIQQNGVMNGRARVTFFNCSSTELWPIGLPNQTSILITTADFLPKPDDFKLTVSPYSINTGSPLAGVKSGNYLDRLIAKSEARSRGFHECIQVNERGEVVSAAMANVFWLKDKKLFTPSLKTGCVAGTTRLMVSEGRECFEVELDIDVLRSADEILLTSAGLGIVPVAEFDGRKLRRESRIERDLIFF